MSAPAQPKPGLSTRATTPEDRAEQAALYDLCFQKEDGSRIVPWRYDRNPHGPAITRVAADEGGALLSHYACSPRVVLHRGEEPARPLVGQTGDVMTHPEHRKLGIFSRLDRESMADANESGWSMVFGLPNRQSAHIFTRDLGWKEVGKIRPWTFVLVPNAAARTERMKAGRLASAAVPWTFWRGTMRRGALRKNSFGKINVVPLARFSEEVDAVGQAVAKDFPFMVRRDHAYLNWRFFDAPSGRFQAQGAFAPGGAMVGYCIVQLPEKPGEVGYVVDVVGINDAAIDGCIEASLGHLQKSSASVARAHAIAGSWWEKRLRHSGFRAPKADDHKIVIAHLLDEENPLCKAASNPASWYFTDGDRDDELVR
ncbi:MAG: GNAT family N-acetyltransferase [Planctomycetota bacterium]|nr:GNAT family N-acetyltransferase [Planctomycetota bacterium]